MKTVIYSWNDFQKVEATIQFISDVIPCFVSTCRAAGYVRIECRVEDVAMVKRFLTNSADFGKFQIK